MLVGFESIGTENPKEFFEVTLSSDRFIIKSDGSSDGLFAHSLAAFIQYLLDNHMIEQKETVDGILKDVIAYGIDLKDYSIPFRGNKIDLSWTELFTVLKYYGEEVLELKYPDYMKDIDTSMFQLSTNSVK